MPSRNPHSHQCNASPNARLAMSAIANPVRPHVGISATAKIKCAQCIITITASVSRTRRCARMTPAMDAFHASNNMAGARACRKGVANGNTSIGACMMLSNNAAPPNANDAVRTPTHVLAPNTARATASAVSRRPLPRLCATTTLTPAPTIRKRINSIAEIWFANANAAPAGSLMRAARIVPMTPTPMPSPSSRNIGQAISSKRGRANDGEWD